MRHLFSVLLLLYPRAFREEFAEEIRAVFLQAAGDRRAQGWLHYVVFLCGEVGGLAQNATRLRISGLSHPTRVPVGLLLAAVALSTLILFSRRRYPAMVPVVSANEELLELLTLATVSVVLVAAAAVAFVLNLRILSRRGEARPRA